MAPKREKIKTFELDTELDEMPDQAPAPVLPQDGERQVSPTLDGIAPDHRKRYEFAAHGLRARAEALGARLSVLDACCGTGYGSSILASQAGCFVDAFDVSAAAIEFAQYHYRDDNIHYSVGNAETVELATYDAIVCFEALEHLEATVVMERFRRALKPGGILLISVPNEETVPFSPQTHPFHQQHYTPAEFERLLTGWTIVDRKHQVDKWGGEVREGWAGRTLIAVARR